MPIVPFIPAIIGAGVGLYGASQAKKSANQALDAQTQANDKSLAVQQQALNTVVGLNEPFRQGGLGAFDKLLAEFGLPSSSGAAPAPARTSVVGAQGMGGYSSPTERAKVPGAPAGTSPLELGGAAPQGGAQTQDWNAYLTAHPDVASGYKAYQQGSTKGFDSPGTEGQSWGDWGYQPGLTAEQFAAQYQQTTGQGAGYTVPTMAAPVEAPSPSNPPTDLLTAQRPDAPARVETAAPTFTRQADMAAPTFGDAPQFKNYFDPQNFTQDPSYLFRQKQGLDAANTQFAGRGLLKSSGAAKGIADYASNLASQEYGNAFSRAQSLYNNDLGQYNNNRNFLEGNYEYGQNRQDTNFSADRSSGLNLFTQQQARNDANTNTDRSRLDTNWNADRNFQANRYDTRVGNLFDLAKIGQQAAGNVGGATTANANNQSSIFGSQANATADAANSRAAANAYGVGALGAAAGNAFAAYKPAGGGAGDPYSDYSFYKGAF